MKWLIYWFLFSSTEGTLNVSGVIQVSPTEITVYTSQGYKTLPVTYYDTGTASVLNYMPAMTCIGQRDSTFVTFKIGKKYAHYTYRCGKFQERIKVKILKGEPVPEPNNQ